MDEVKHMRIAEFRSQGYLHEVNRLLLHPLGLALSVSCVTEPGRRITLKEEDAQEILAALASVADGNPTLARLGYTIEQAEVLEEGHEFLGNVWDDRDDPEGIYFGDDLLSAEKAEQVAVRMFTRRKARADALGYVVQPVENVAPTLTTTYIDPAERQRGAQ